MIHSRVRRLTRGSLDGTFGPDRDKRLVVAFIPGDGDKVPDMLELRPIRTRRPERIAVIDVYRYAIRCRVNLGVLAKARAKKDAKAQRLANERIARREKRLFRKEP